MKNNFNNNKTTEKDQPLLLKRKIARGADPGVKRRRRREKRPRRDILPSGRRRRIPRLRERGETPQWPAKSNSF